GPRDELDVFVAQRPQLVLDLVAQLGARRLETRLDPGLGRLADADPAFADILQRGLGDVVRPQPGGVGPADQDALGGNFVDRRRDLAPRRRLDVDSEMTGQRLLLALLIVLAL